MNVDHIRQEVKATAPPIRRKTVSLDIANIQAGGRASRKMIAQRILILSQHADAEAPHLRQDAVHIGSIVERNQNERWIERDGDECIGGHPVRPLFKLRRKNRDAAGEAT